MKRIPTIKSVMTPSPLSVAIDWTAWTVPPIFGLIGKYGAVPESDMRRTLNLGIGMVIFVSKSGADTFMKKLRSAVESPVIIGEIMKDGSAG